jgi:hypothetical protein
MSEGSGSPFFIGYCGIGFGGSKRSSTTSETQKMFMLLHRLATSTSLGVVGFVTQPSALTGSATASRLSTSEPPSAPSPSTYPWILDFSASFYVILHSAHLFSLCSARHLSIHTADGSPLSVVGRDTLFV